MAQTRLGADQVDLSVDTYNDLLSLTDVYDGMSVYVDDEDTTYAWDSPTNTWVLPKIRSIQLANGWLSSVMEFTDLPSSGNADGDVRIVITERIPYMWVLDEARWIPLSASLGGGAITGCRLKYVSATTIQVNAGSVDVFNNNLKNNGDTILTWADVEAGTTQKANTWYYVYAKQDPNNPQRFIAYISEKSPLAEQYTVTADAYIKKKYPTTNYGTGTTLYMSKFGDNHDENGEIFIKCNLAATTLTSIATGMLNVFYNDNPHKHYNQVRVYELNSDWDENTITWNNAPAKGNLITTSYVGSKGIQSFDLTNYINTKLGTTKMVNVVLDFEKSTSKHTYMYSRENSIYKPYISLGAKSLGRAKYHTNDMARFIGSFKTDGSQNIIPFKLLGDWVYFLNTGYNYILQDASTADTKVAANCRSFVPYTSDHCMLLCAYSNDSLHYLGGVNNWYFYSGARGNKQVSIPVTNDSIYYQTKGADKMSIGVTAYYEEV